MLIINILGWMLDIQRSIVFNYCENNGALKMEREYNWLGNLLGKSEKEKEREDYIHILFKENQNDSYHQTTFYR